MVKEVVSVFVGAKAVNMRICIFDALIIIKISV